LWQVAACNNRQIIFPPDPAWVVTTSPDQLVTFTIDVTQTSRPLFLAARHVVSANDSASQFRVVGNFQEWNADDPSGVLQPSDSFLFPGIYQQVRRIAQRGRYNGYVIAGDKARWGSVIAIDGYGRTTQPIPLTFQTRRPDDYVVFLLDLNQGQATVLYNMPVFLTRMAFGNGYLIVGAVVGVVALASILWLLWRSILLLRYRSWLEAGCPRCHNHELMRVERHPIDRLLQALGLPAYRYQCRNCPWQGLRLSMGGLSTSPRSKSRLAQAQQQ
jgi:hypothetical protein